MDDFHAPPPQILEALARGWTVLTANQRAARTLRRAFDRRQQALGLANWQPPAILAWDSWLSSLWHSLLLEGHASALLLNPTQEHTLWRDIVQADSRAAATLRPIDSLAELAASAWLLLHSYRGRQRLQSSTDSVDTRAFARWANEFERLCGRANYLTVAQLPEALRDAVAAGQLTLPPGLLLVGFDQKTPAQIALLESVQASGAMLEELDPGPASISRSLGATIDEHEELTACARWVRDHLTANPTSELAVIVPSLDTTRAEIDRVFRYILAPELEDITATGSSPFEFSLGVPLAQTPMAATALDILRWAIGPLPLDRVSALLLSPHLAASSPESGAEYLARAEFDAFTLRRAHLLQPQITLNDLLAIAAHSKFSARLATLLQHLRTLRALLNKKDHTVERTHADWAATIHDILEAAGWAIGSQDNSIEFQTRRKWESALDELPTLDFSGLRVPFAAALAALERIAAQTLFAPESRHAPIQIMGPLESAGSTFDALWFLHTGDLSWPAKPVPNPLLPWHLQCELLMPGVDPARDAIHARRITERIAASASTILFSYAHETPDGHQRPSPALASLALEPRSATEIAPADPYPVPISLEAVADDAPIPPPPDCVFKGGASILALQAACGFRAFAEKRLFASALDARELGLDPRERGSLVHDVLEHFWAEVETQAALELMSYAERDALLAHSIDAALADHTTLAAHGWNRAYLDTERRRLLNLLRPWLNYELTRPPFAVQSRETELKDVQIGPLHLNIRVDRIDRTLTDGEPDGGEIILDYKTGPAKPADWLGDRPDAPQLPLYAVVSEFPHLAAVAFANIRAGKDMDLSGYESSKGTLPKATKLKTSSLEAQVDEWRATLITLAEDFHSGAAHVSPKQYPSTCRYCEQRLLCRLDLATLEADAIEELTADGDSDETPEADRG